MGGSSWIISIITIIDVKKWKYLFFYQVKIHANNICVIKKYICNTYFFNEEKSRYCFHQPLIWLLYLLWFSVREAYNMGIAALTLVVLVVLGWALRLIFRRFGVKCRTPVRRQPKGTDRLRGLEEGSRVEIRKGSSTAVKTLGLEVNDNLIKIQ